MKTYYIKSNKCKVCKQELQQTKHDGLFLCADCCCKLEKQIKSLLEEKSEYGEYIQDVSLNYLTNFGKCSNKTTYIKIKNYYLELPTYKLMEIIELNPDIANNDLLLEYLNIEIKIYTLYKDKLLQDEIKRGAPVAKSLWIDEYAEYWDNKYTMEYEEVYSKNS